MPEEVILFASTYAPLAKFLIGRVNAIPHLCLPLRGLGAGVTQPERRVSA
jgi:hypothetical protein